MNICKIYTDGSQLTLTYSTGSATTQTWFSSDADIDVLTIGGNKDNTTRIENIFSGLIDEVRVYSKALSETEITTNYNNGKSAHSQVTICKDNTHTT